MPDFREEEFIPMPDLDFAWSLDAVERVPFPTGMPLRGQLRRDRVGEPTKPRSSKKPEKEPSIEFHISRDKSDKYYIITAVDANDNSKPIDSWTASTEEEANAVIQDIGGMFSRRDKERSATTRADLSLRGAERQRGHLTRDDRMSLRGRDGDILSEDTFNLDIDEDAVAEEEKKRAPRTEVRYSFESAVPF